MFGMTPSKVTHLLLYLYNIKEEFFDKYLFEYLLSKKTKFKNQLCINK